jgi:hypothetical protein
MGYSLTSTMTPVLHISICLQRQQHDVKMTSAYHDVNSQNLGSLDPDPTWWRIMNVFLAPTMAFGIGTSSPRPMGYRDYRYRHS